MEIAQNLKWSCIETPTHSVVIFQAKLMFTSLICLGNKFFEI